MIIQLHVIIFCNFRDKYLTCSYRKSKDKTLTVFLLLNYILFFHLVSFDFIVFLFQFFICVPGKTYSKNRCEDKQCRRPAFSTFSCGILQAIRSHYARKNNFSSEKVVQDSFLKNFAARQCSSHHVEVRGSL